MMKSMVFILEMEFGESYLYGRATLEDRTTYQINIQGGNMGVLLPRGLEFTSDALVHFDTENGKQVTIRSRVEADKDWIEIYGDGLLAKLAEDLPVKMTVEVPGQNS